MSWHDGTAALRRALATAVSVAVAAGAIAACSPTYDWRQARPEGSGVTMMFPCRPARVGRHVRIGDAGLVMQLHSCKADGAVFSLAVTDAGSADRVVPLLGALRREAVASVAGTVTTAAASASAAAPASPVAGSMSNPQSGRVRIDGRLPDGRPVVEHAAFFSRGTALYQATVVTTGKPLAEETLDTFFGALHVQ